MSAAGGKKYDAKKKTYEDGGASEIIRRSISQIPSRFFGVNGERTVRRLRLSRALTIPETTNILEASQRMAKQRVDAVLLTDSNKLLCGILTDKVLEIFLANRSEPLDVNAVNYVGLTPLDILLIFPSEVGDREMQEVLQRAGVYPVVPVVATLCRKYTHQSNQ